MQMFSMKYLVVLAILVFVIAHGIGESTFELKEALPSTTGGADDRHNNNDVEDLPDTTTQTENAGLTTPAAAASTDATSAKKDITGHSSLEKLPHWSPARQSWECSSLSGCAAQPDPAEAKAEKAIADLEEKEASQKNYIKSSLVQSITSCQVCPAACPAGLRCEDCYNGDRQCNECAAGKYSPNGVADCHTCSAGSTSSPGSGHCDSCPAGRSSQPGDAECSVEDSTFEGIDCNATSTTKTVWLGSYNTTHVGHNPVHDGPMTNDAKQNGCETQGTVPDTGGTKNFRSATTCSSCKREYHFMMLWHKSRLGRCHKPSEKVKSQCAELNKDDPGSNLMTEDYICTKSVVSNTTVKVDKLEGETRKAFLAVKGSFGGSYASIRCAARKETVCQMVNGVNSCQVRKRVDCLEMCQMNDILVEGAPSGKFKYGKCTACGTCKDTLGFDNGYNKGCAGYVQEGWCKDRRVVETWTTGDKYKNPEKHCCECGGGHLTGPPVNPCRDVAISA